MTYALVVLSLSVEVSVEVSEALFKLYRVLLYPSICFIVSFGEGKLKALSLARAYLSLELILPSPSVSYRGKMKEYGSMLKTIRGVGYFNEIK